MAGARTRGPRAHGREPKDSLTLENLGWDGRREEQFAPFRADGLEPGRVALEHTHIYRVVTPSEDVLRRGPAAARGGQPEGFSSGG